ncbi:ABC transporter permease [Mucilaginibacter endophyticus]|uniref:ABC transporter permease n=1 Tax=Mucilaginibacter endophyticus TaxID=2675003 RepID=UPI000E0CE237|nr:ABC transporter permease [Mucilaginibacter endophyticus]
MKYNIGIFLKLPFVSPNLIPVLHKSIASTMIKNYFKTALRNFWMHRIVTLINMLGLSIGVSAALAIYIIVSFDLSFDKFHADSDRIYRVVTDFSFMDKVVARLGKVNGPLPAAIKAEVTGVKTAAPFLEMKETNVLIPNQTSVPAKFTHESNIVIADRAYFELFNYSWLAGSARTALQKPYEVVLTSDQARKYFPNVPYNELLGKTVIYDSIKTTVAGVVQTPVQNTDLYFKDFISYATCLSNTDMRNMARLTEWPGVAWQLFIKTDEHANVADIEARINGAVKKFSKDFRPGDEQIEHLQPLRDLHFDPVYANFEKGRRASRATIYSLLVVAGFLLLLGCINFINLSTAQASKRAKEIGIRKTMGSSRWQLITQFLSETCIITFFSICIAIILTPFILNFFSDFIPPGVSFNYLDIKVWLFLFALLIVVTLSAGLYPAIILSGYRPTSVLSGFSDKAGGNSRGILLRRSLSVMQFVIAQFFIMVTLLVNKQVFYALHKDMGFRKAGIINISTPLNLRNTNKQQLFKDKISNIPQIELMSTGSEPPADENIGTWEVTYNDGKKQVKTTVQQRNGDENYLKVYNIKLLAGRNLLPADSMTAVLVNETYIHAIGFRNPADAVGASFDYEGNKRMIVGVVADFHQKSLRDPVAPVSIQAPHYRFNDRFFHILLKPQVAGSNDWSDAISSMKKAWAEVYPDVEFDYHFFDEEVARFYESDRRTSKLLSWATGFSILISCLGLLGFTVFNIGRRTKEIGIRKVLGASVVQLVGLLVSEIAWIIILSFVLVIPFAWVAMNKWLQNFAEHTTISWWIFILSGIGMLFAAILTSGFQTAKAAIANPTKSLRKD